MNIEELKKVASLNCGACGDAFAVGAGLSVVCWAMADGSFRFAVSLGGNDVQGFSESAIDALMIIRKAKVVGASGATDRRGLAA